MNKIIPLVPVDTGTAYGRPTPSHLKNMTEVGPGTPMGELLRRYWHPIGLAADATDTGFAPMRVSRNSCSTP